MRHEAGGQGTAAAVGVVDGLAIVATTDATCFFSEDVQYGQAGDEFAQLIDDSNRQLRCIGGEGGGGGGGGGERSCSE